MDTFDSPRSSVPARLAGPRGAATVKRFDANSNDPAPSPISIRVAFRGIRRYWWLILALWVVGSAGAGAGIYLKIKASYKASSLLRVSPSQTDLYNIYGHGEALDQFLNTQVSLITSPNVLSAAGTNPKASALPRVKSAGDVVLELKKVISVSILPGTYLIEVSMTGPSAYEAATLVNAVVEAFIESNGQWSEGQTRGQIENLQAYLLDLKTQSEDKERRWRELIIKGDGGVVPVRPAPGTTKGAEPASLAVSTFTLEQYKKIETDLFEVRLDLTEKKAIAQKLRRDLDNVSRNPVISEDEGRTDSLVRRRLETDPDIRSIYTQMNDAREKLDDLKARTRHGNDPAILKAQTKYRQLEGQYKSTWNTRDIQYREEIAAGGPGKGMDLETEAKAAEELVVRLNLRADTLEQELAKVKVDKRSESIDAVDIELNAEARRSLVGMQETVLKRLEQLKFESKGEARIRSVNLAVPPGKPISDKRMQFLAMAPVGVLGAVLVLVVVLELRSARVGDTELLASRVRNEVFAIAPLPNIRPGEDANDGRAEQRLARFIQSLDHLRVALCEAGVPGEGRCVMITSANGGEGKTTLSAHLAARCANAGTSTILIDADMRRASLGRLLDVPVGPGLADVLDGEIDLESALVTVQAGGFHFLSAGTPGRDPARVLRSAGLAELLGRLRATYDLVLIDTPPILPVADAIILGRWADGAVMAARYDASRLPLVERANRQLAAAGIPVLGVVVNGVRGSNDTYGDYAYGYSYLKDPADRDRSGNARTA